MGVRTRSLNPFFKLLFCVFANITEGKYSAFLWLCFLLLKWSICFSVNCLLCVSCWFYLNAYDVTLVLIYFKPFSYMGPSTAVFAKISTARPQASGRLTACVSARELRESLRFLGPCADAVAWWVLAKQ